MELIKLDGGGRTSVYKHEATVVRESGYWSTAVIALLKELERCGYEYSPKVIGCGFDVKGRENLSFIEGEAGSGVWSEEGFFSIGTMLRELHDLSASITLPESLVWRKWFGRSKNSDSLVYGHGDLGPWNIIHVNGNIKGFIDWEVAGPVDPMVDLAYACWLNAQLYDDEMAEKNSLPSLESRCKLLNVLLAGYGLGNKKGFVATIIETAVHDTARQATENDIRPEGTNPDINWAFAWRARSASWMIANRSILVELIEG